MNNSILENKGCCCSSAFQQEQNDSLKKTVPKINKTLKSLPSILLSVFIAFFPKCPICWAVYMSMFGSFGLAQLPYMAWLFPVLIGFLGIHLYMIYKKSTPTDYWPFLLSLVGALVILIGRFSFGNEKWILILGMFFIISGSLLIQFPSIRIHSFTSKQN